MREMSIYPTPPPSQNPPHFLSIGTQSFLPLPLPYSPLNPSLFLSSRPAPHPRTPTFHTINFSTHHADKVSARRRGGALQRRGGRFFDAAARTAEPTKTGPEICCFSCCCCGEERGEGEWSGRERDEVDGQGEATGYEGSRAHNLPLTLNLEALNCATGRLRRGSHNLNPKP